MWINKHRDVMVFDAEWVPCPATGRRVYGLPASMSDDEVIARMYQEGGATAENPRPYLKTVLCRVVSIAAVRRRVGNDGRVALTISSQPSATEPDVTEGEIIKRFLTAVGKDKPQLVGFNSQSSDLVILLQRALVNSLALPGFCQRPAKPWEGADYFARYSDHNIDLKEMFGGWGKSTPSLHELATACGVPGKIGTGGGDVAQLWRDGKKREIVQYNECDAITTYLVWLRAALLGGHVTAEAHAVEEKMLEELLKSKIEAGGNDHLRAYLDAWSSIRA